MMRKGKTTLKQDKEYAAKQAHRWLGDKYKFYDDLDFLKKLLGTVGSLRWRDRLIDSTQKYVSPFVLRKGDIVIDCWDRVGMVAAVFKTPIKEEKYADFAFIVKERNTPYLKIKHYWTGMLGKFRFLRMTK